MVVNYVKLSQKSAITETRMIPASHAFRLLTEKAADIGPLPQKFEILTYPYTHSIKAWRELLHRNHRSFHESLPLDKRRSEILKKNKLRSELQKPTKYRVECF